MAPGSSFALKLVMTCWLPSQQDEIRNILMVAHKVLAQGVPYVEEPHLHKLPTPELLSYLMRTLNNWYPSVNQRMKIVLTPLWRGVSWLPVLWRKGCTGHFMQRCMKF